MIPNNVKIIGKDIINDRYIILTLSRPKNFTFKAGQYLISKFEDKLQRIWIQRTYSILSSEDDRNLSFGIKIDDGLGAQAILHDIVLGDEITILGPFGKFTYDKKNQKEAGLKRSRSKGSGPKDVFIATGIGITPIKSIIESLTKKDDVYLFWGVKDNLDLIFNFDSLGDRFKYTFSKDQMYIQSLIGDFLITNKNKLISFYISGHPDNVESIKKFIVLNYKRIDIENIYTEKF